MSKNPMTETEYDRQVNGAILDGGALDFNFNRRFTQSLTRRGLTLTPVVDGETAPMSYATIAPAARPTKPDQPTWPESWIVEAGQVVDFSIPANATPVEEPVAEAAEAAPVEQTEDKA